MDKLASAVDFFLRLQIGYIDNIRCACNDEIASYTDLLVPIRLNLFCLSLSQIGSASFRSCSSSFKYFMVYVDSVNVDFSTVFWPTLVILEIRLMSKLKINIRARLKLNY